MAHDLTSDMLAVTLAPVCRPIVFIQVTAEGGNVNLWTGVGNYLWNSITWLGAGQILGIGAVTEQNKVQASGTELRLSGINTDYIAIILEDLQRYLPAKLWLGAIDDDFNLVSDPYLFLNGRIDTGKITETGKTATISISVESRLIAMRNPRVRRLTDLDQRIEHPGDGGFTFVDTIQDASIEWHG